MSLFSFRSRPTPVEGEVLVAEVVEQQPANQLPRRVAMGVSLVVAALLAFNYAKRYNLIPANLGGGIDAPKSKLTAAPPVTAAPTKQQIDSGVQETVLKPSSPPANDVPPEKPLVIASQTPSGEGAATISMEAAPGIASPSSVVVSGNKVVVPDVSITTQPKPAAIATRPSIQVESAESTRAAVIPVVASQAPAVSVSAVALNDTKAVPAQKPAPSAKPPMTTASASKPHRQPAPDTWQDGKRIF